MTDTKRSYKVLRIGMFTFTAMEVGGLIANAVMVRTSGDIISSEDSTMIMFGTCMRSFVMGVGIMNFILFMYQSKAGEPHARPLKITQAMIALSIALTFCIDPMFAIYWRDTSLQKYTAGKAMTFLTSVGAIFNILFIGASLLTDEPVVSDKMAKAEAARKEAEASDEDSDEE